MSNIIDLSGSILKFKADIADRDKIIQQQQLKIEELQNDLVSMSAVNDMLKLVLLDAISLQKQNVENSASHLEQLQELYHKLPRIAK
jgi:archaellum component FlaC